MKKESMFIIGATSLMISLIMGMFLPDLPLISFIEGIFVGISLTMNLSFLVRYRLAKNSENKVENKEKKLQGDQFGK
ncbi:MAG: hypothetical protein ACFFBF_10270 [Promethearchaeota archaeon]